MIIRRLVVLVTIGSLIFLACSNTNPVPAKSEKNFTPFKYNDIDKNQKDHYHEILAPLYAQLLVNTGFNGGILVAKNGQILFEDYLGVLNTATKEFINSNSKFHIASVSKTFTAIAVLHLMEEGKINLDADVKTYLSNFPYEGITIKNLLSHRSGLPNYVYFMDGRIAETITVRGRRGRILTRTIYKKDPTQTNKLVDNNEVLNFMATKKPKVEAAPNTRFKYCNTNYVLLALIVEKVSGLDFPSYMQKEIFEPLGMKNSYVFSMKDTSNYIPSYRNNYIPYKLEKFDCVFGDKNVYSTPRDLLLWDKALYNNSIVKKETLEMAYTPLSNEKPGTHNYGLGWRLLTNPDNFIPYHNGWWHGNNAVFTRLLKDTATIIVLGNKFNSNIYKARKVLNIFGNNSTDAKDDESLNANEGSENHSGE